MSKPFDPAGFLSALPESVALRTSGAPLGCHLGLRLVSELLRYPSLALRAPLGDSSVGDRTVGAPLVGDLDEIPQAVQRPFPG